MSDQSLSSKLEANGFKDVTGTFEVIKGERYQVVTLKEPRVWDFVNGVTMVTDEKGHPWIKRGRPLLAGITLEENKRGAHVPHSSDGGRFVSEVLPALPVRPVQRQLVRPNWGNGLSDVYKLKPGDLFVLRRDIPIAEQAIFARIAHLAACVPIWAAVVRPNGVLECRELRFKDVWGDWGPNFVLPLTEQDVPGDLAQNEHRFLAEIATHAALGSEGLCEFLSQPDIIGGNVVRYSCGRVFRGIIEACDSKWWGPRLRVRTWAVAPEGQMAPGAGPWESVRGFSEELVNFCPSTWFFQHIDDHTARLDENNVPPWLRPIDYEPCLVFTAKHPDVITADQIMHR